MSEMTQTPELPPELKARAQELIAFINNTPVVLSLLYDLNLLPEQLEERTKQWFDMLNIAAHFKTFQEQMEKTPPQPPN